MHFHAVLLFQLFGNVVVGDGAEQAAIDASLLRELDDGASQLSALLLGGGQFFGGLLFQLGAAGFKLGLVGGGGAARAARRNQEVAGIAVFDFPEE